MRRNIDTSNTVEKLYRIPTNVKQMKDSATTIVYCL